MCYAASMSSTGTLLILGCGYVGERLAVAAIEQGMKVIGSTRHAVRADDLRARGIEAVVAASPVALPGDVLRQCDAVLDSIPLEHHGRRMRAPQLQWLPEVASRLSHVRWAGYLSTTGVYGDAGGAWVDEAWPCKPTSERGKQRLAAEVEWLDSGLPAEVFRIAGIYGPGRNLIAKLMEGSYQAVRWQPAHWSSRIHVDDIVAAILAAMQRPRSGRIVNLADDLPMPHDQYVCELAARVGAPEPQLLTPEQGELHLPPAMLDFFRDSKRVSNRRLHEELLPALKYPSFRDAVDDLLGSIR